MLRKKIRISREQMLGSRPVRNQVLEWKRKDNKVLIVFRRKQSKSIGFLSKIFHIPEKKVVELDSLGARVWQMCDGQHTVEKMIEALVAENKLEYKEAEVALVQFLKTLAQKRMIAFQVPTQRPRKFESAEDK
ncbi:MAG: hypothetical protein DRQ02_02730 [Candidatus Latescibacterota bacterium]|nr:MAG: hypothetical protein DRQ02_02730 [Candidatus Latescibacterota bacterium]RKY73195.1 MAG: hypothetical protein DRQ24_02875 [Candidatus Latescibacterota bacterium]